MNIEQAQRIPLSVILDKMGKAPQRTNGHRQLYSSPLRNERTPSLWVNTKTNRWRDFGDDKWKGGDTVHLVRGYLYAEGESFEVTDALRWIRNMTDYIPRIRPVPVEEYKEDASTLKLRSVGPIQKEGLVQYGESRGIPSSILKTYFQEIRFLNRNTEKTTFALCMKNESKGYEIRNSFFKGTIQKKDITFIRGTVPKPPGILIFEGMMDFATIIAQRNGKPLEDDAMILNSLACLDQGSAYIRNYGYRFCYTYMDNDQPGISATKSWAEFCKTEEELIHYPMNESYMPYKDVNAHHMAQLEL